MNITITPIYWDKYEMVDHTHDTTIRRYTMQRVEEVLQSNYGTKSVVYGRKARGHVRRKRIMIFDLSK